MKYLGVLIDKYLTWKEHTGVIENKVSENLDLLCKAKRVPDSTGLKNVYFFFIDSYLNYGNIVWASTSRTKLKKQPVSQNKH